MRVITGTAKGKRLKPVPGNTTRPITDRVKEALFSILGTWIVDAEVLDLFGGTGAVGIEALSRGAAQATFIEKSAPAYRVLRENLQDTHLLDRARLIRGDAFKMLPTLAQTPFDLIYIAPPQYKKLWQRVLLQIDTQPDMLYQDGLVIVQIHPREFEELKLTNLVLYDERRYGSTLLCFYETRAHYNQTADPGDTDD